MINEVLALNYKKIKRGIYKHFKDKPYTVFGTAIDTQNNQYVFYRQNYGSNDFWIRPYDNFIGKVPEEPSKKRFSFESKLEVENLYHELGELLQTHPFTVKHSETEDTYLIYSVPNDYNEPIKISSFRELSYNSAYLTDFQIAQRMGYYLYSFRGEKCISKFPIEQEENLKLNILSDYSPKQTIEEYLANPCSLDLRIADNFFCKTCRKKIDLLSMLRYHIKSTDLWKEVKLKEKNGTHYFILRPGKTIVTHTFEKISLPADCAGKIEIKSTYARLSLSITTSDFCNPGWSGYFPLVIHNEGKHKIILHPKEKMLQLMLVPTQSPIINEYSKNSTFMDDDGKPYRFWQSKAAKQFRKKHGLNEITDFYEKATRAINENNCDNVEGCKDRFTDSFLLFCEKELLRKKKYQKLNNKDKVKELWKTYKKSEQTKMRLSSFKLGTLLLAILPSLIEIGYDYLKDKTISPSPSMFICGLISAFLLVGFIYFIIKVPKLFCSFEKLEYDKIINQ